MNVEVGKPRDIPFTRIIDVGFVTEEEFERRKAVAREAASGTACGSCVNCICTVGEGNDLKVGCALKPIKLQVPQSTCPDHLGV